MIQKFKDDKHILMARINNFASSLRAAVYRANDHYDPHNPPMTMANVRKYTDKWNQGKVRGMDCTREEVSDARSETRACLYIRELIWKH